MADARPPLQGIVTASSQQQQRTGGGAGIGGGSRIGGITNNNNNTQQTSYGPARQQALPPPPTVLPSSQQQALQPALIPPPPPTFTGGAPSQPPNYPPPPPPGRRNGDGGGVGGRNNSNDNIMSDTEELMNNLETQQDQLQQQIETLSESIKQARRRAASYRDYASQLQRSYDEQKKALQQVEDDFASQVDNLTRERNALTREIDDLRNSSANRADLAAAIEERDAVTAQLRDAQQQIENLRAELARTAAEAAQNTGLAAQQSNLGRRLVERLERATNQIRQIEQLVEQLSIDSRVRPTGASIASIATVLNAPAAFNIFCMADLLNGGINGEFGIFYVPVASPTDPAFAILAERYYQLFESFARLLYVNKVNHLGSNNDVTSDPYSSVNRWWLSSIYFYLQGMYAIGQQSGEKTRVDFFSIDPTSTSGDTWARPANPTAVIKTVMNAGALRQMFFDVCQHFNIVDASGNRLRVNRGDYNAARKWMLAAKTSLPKDMIFVPDMSDSFQPFQALCLLWCQIAEVQPDFVNYVASLSPVNGYLCDVVQDANTRFVLPTKTSNIILRDCPEREAPTTSIYSSLSNIVSAPPPYWNVVVLSLNTIEDEGVRDTYERVLRQSGQQPAQSRRQQNIQQRQLTGAPGGRVGGGGGAALVDASRIKGRTVSEVPPPPRRLQVGDGGARASSSIKRTRQEVDVGSDIENEAMNMFPRTTRQKIENGDDDDDAYFSDEDDDGYLTQQEDGDNNTYT